MPTFIDEKLPTKKNTIKKILKKFLTDTIFIIIFDQYFLFFKYSLKYLIILNSILLLDLVPSQSDMELPRT